MALNRPMWRKLVDANSSDLSLRLKLAKLSADRVIIIIIIITAFV